MTIDAVLSRVHQPPPRSSFRRLLGRSLSAHRSDRLYVWQLFKRAADVEGLMGALALLPEEKRTLYRKHLDANKQPWWNPDAIWANWPKMLDELKIASPAAWK
jgi:hypothetical protein